MPIIFDQTDNIYNKLKSIRPKSFFTEIPHDLTPYHYFASSQMVFSNKAGKFYTDDINECVVTILYNDYNELFAIHSNPTSMVEYNGIINNFCDKSNLKAVLIGGSKESSFISRRNIMCVFNSLNRSKYDITITDAFIEKGVNSILIDFDKTLKLTVSNRKNLNKNEDLQFMQSWNELRHNCLFLEAEKYGWKTANNIAIWSYKSAIDSDAEIKKPQIPQNFLEKVQDTYDKTELYDSLILLGDTITAIKYRDIVKNFIIILQELMSGLIVIKRNYLMMKKL